MQIICEKFYNIKCKFIVLSHKMVRQGEKILNSNQIEKGTDSFYTHLHTQYQINVGKSLFIFGYFNLMKIYIMGFFIWLNFKIIS